MGAFKRSPGCKCCHRQATLTGNVMNGCVTGAGVSGAIVTVGPVGGGTPYGTLSTGAGGAFSGPITIPSSPIQATVTAAISPSDAHAARYGTSSATVTLTSGRETPAGTFYLPAAPGYHCLSGFAYPLPNTLHLTDTKNGAFTLTWSNINTWQVAADINYPGCGSPSCGALNHVPCIYSLYSSAGPPATIQLLFSYGRYPINSCPYTSRTYVSMVNAIVTPTADPFHIMQSVPASNSWYCNGTHTWTITE